MVSKKANNFKIYSGLLFTVYVRAWLSYFPRHSSLLQIKPTPTTNPTEKPFVHKNKFISSRGLQSFVLKPFNLSIYHSSLHHIWQMPSSNLTIRTLWCTWSFISSRGLKGFSHTPFTPKISIQPVILLTVCHKILTILVWRIWYWINW